MGKPQIVPYGSWKSPVTSELVASKKVWLSSIVFDGEDIYWVEIRPSEEGRYIIVRRTPDGQISDVTPPPLNARTRVHEYGGGAYTVGDGTIYFSNFDDQRIYCQELGAAPHPVTPEADLRYADIVIDRHRNRIICVRAETEGASVLSFSIFECAHASMSLRGSQPV